MRSLRKALSRSVPALVLLLSSSTIATTIGLERRAATSSDAEARLVRVDSTLTRLQGDPFDAMAVVGGSRSAAYAAVAEDQRRITAALAALREHDPPAALGALSRPLRANFAAIDALLPIVASKTFTTRLDPRFYGLLKASTDTSATAHRLLADAGREYGARADRTQTQATAGSTAMILLLFGAFALIYRRASRARTIAERLAAENAQLAASAGHEARTDALTGLGNRRALSEDLAGELSLGGDQDGVLLAHFDLDGFKHYNDTFGHPAGDGLLTRLGQRLEAAVAGVGGAYRMGGDEFCVLAHVAPEADDSLVALAAEALSEVGDAFQISCSHGAVRIPREATTAEAAMHLADRRMYEHKASWASASRQSSDVLLKVLSERNADLAEHINSVAELAIGVARQLALPTTEVNRIGIAAELHDVGKAAIPDAILDKPGPLDDDEWAFMRQHTLIGERIMLVAPSLAATAELVRSSHEAFDGSGYPDGLLAEDIPLGARIIAVCDAFDAMTATRTYRAAMEPKDAYAELRRCSGTQFDPSVVAAFCSLGLHDDAPAERRFAPTEAG
jgi:diguanylate cyclase (GGDEF)-like protein